MAVNENKERKRKRVRSDVEFAAPYALILAVRGYDADHSAKSFQIINRKAETNGERQRDPLHRSEVWAFMDKHGYTAGDIARGMEVNPRTIRRMCSRNAPGNECVLISIEDLIKARHHLAH